MRKIVKNLSVVLFAWGFMMLLVTGFWDMVIYFGIKIAKAAWQS